MSEFTEGELKVIKKALKTRIEFLEKMQGLKFIDEIEKDFEKEIYISKSALNITEKLLEGKI